MSNKCFATFPNIVALEVLSFVVAHTRSLAVRRKNCSPIWCWLEFKENLGRGIGKSVELIKESANMSTLYKARSPDKMGTFHFFV